MASESFQVRVVTPSRSVLSRSATAVTLPTIEGQITILAGHARLLSVLTPGLLRVVGGKGPQDFRVSAGFVEASAQVVTILAEGAEEI